ncbi:MAG: uroporphyrinogen-III synthase [Micavibrio sp.]
MSKTVLITRPREEYEATAAMVQALGFTPVSCPMLLVEELSADFSDIERFQGLVFTSAGAVGPFAKACSCRDLPVYTVGDVTAERVRAQGFEKVTSAGADLNALESLLKEQNLSPDKPLLHISGVDIVRPLQVSGLLIERRIVYKTVLVEQIPDEILEKMVGEPPSAVLFYSARTAEAFAKAMKFSRKEHYLMTTKALCLADSMVESLRSLPWRSLQVAATPDRAGMQALLSAQKEMEETMMNALPDNATGQTTDQDAIEPAEAVIERFGGIRPMATKMSVPVTTVQGWKKRNVIPGNRREDVLEAARQNNIEISDILNKAVANQNAGQNTVQDKAQTAPMAAPMPAAAGQEGISLDVLKQQMKQVESSAVKKSAAITVGLLSAVALAAAVLLGPGAQKARHADQTAVQEEVQSLRDDVNRIDSDVTEIKEAQFSFKKLIPEDLDQTLSDIKQQATDMKQSVTTLSAQVGTFSEVAQTMTGGVLGAEAGDLQARMAALESQIQSLTGSSDLSSVLQKIAEMQQSVQGQELLSTSTSQLGDLLKNLGGDMSQLGPQLENAQTQNNELGQTLEGVSQTDLKAAAMLLALTQFRSSLKRNASFEEDLALMRSMVGEEDTELLAALDRLSPQASKGVLTSQGLSDQLKGLTGDIVVSSIKGEDVSVKEKATARLNEVFQIQKDGELVTGTDTQAIIARAQKLLDEGQVDQAVTELQSLQGPARETAQPLIDEALMTSLADQVSVMLTNKVAAEIPPQTALSQTISNLGNMGGNIGSNVGGLPADIMEGLDPQALGQSLGQMIKGGLGSQSSVPYTASGAQLEGLMQTLESIKPAPLGDGEPIFMPQQ